MPVWVSFSWTDCNCYKTNFVKSNTKIKSYRNYENFDADIFDKISAMDSKTCFNYAGFQKDDASNIKAKLHIYDEEFNEGNNAQITIRNLLL